jgi:hypothetical protein
MRQARALPLYGRCLPRAVRTRGRRLPGASHASRWLRAGADHQRVQVRPRLRSAHRRRAMAASRWRWIGDPGAHADWQRRPRRRCEQRGCRAASACGGAGRGPGRSLAEGRRHEHRVGGVESADPRVVPADSARVSGPLVRARERRHRGCVRSAHGQGDLPAAIAGNRQRFQRIAGCGRRKDLPLERGRRDPRRFCRPRVPAHRDQSDGRTTDGHAGAVSRHDVCVRRP